MNYVKFLESKLGSVLSRIPYFNLIILKLWLRQRNKCKIWLIEESLITKFGERKIQKVINKHKVANEILWKGNLITSINTHIAL